MQNIDEIGKAFVTHYYTIFDTDPQKLASLYQDSSYLSMEGKRVQGPAAIMQSLQAFLFQEGRPKFQALKHQPTVMDCQPTFQNGIMIYVSGVLIVDNNQEQPMPFSQCFQLMPLPQGGGYFCLNDIFRLGFQ